MADTVAELVREVAALMFPLEAQRLDDVTATGDPNAFAPSSPGPTEPPGARLASRSWYRPVAALVGRGSSAACAAVVVICSEGSENAGNSATSDAAAPKSVPRCAIAITTSSNAQPTNARELES